MPDGDVSNRILAAAVEVFGEVGYYGATMEVIAARAGMNATVLQADFPDVAMLLLAALTRRDDGDGDEVHIFERPGGLRLLGNLVGMVRAADPAAAKMHTVISAEAINPAHPARPWAAQRYQWTRSLFAAAIRRDQEAGLIRPEVDAAEIAMRLIAMMDGLQLQWLIEPDEVDMVAAFESFVRDIADAITLPQDTVATVPQV